MLYVTYKLTLLTIDFNWLKSFDEWLFTQINSHFTNAFFDSVFPWWRDSNTWIPLYLFLLLFMFINFGKKTFTWLLFLIITITLTDQISAHVIKNLVQRERPCADHTFFIQVRMLLNHCSGGYSFPSSHATNHFGLAIFLLITLSNVLQRWKFVLLFWAATIAYGQVYVGVHYPLDIFCGAVLGSIIGLITALVYKMKFGMFEVDISKHSTV